ncbi:MAG TPA: hypothetical protein VHT25_09000 [Solirubrobacteraceae bacterium]|jgi:hypothetical protein|nr:hypothetical protein [Solirubrobacteraceae bacterium]
MSDSINYGISGVEKITAENLAVGPGSKVEQSGGSQSLAQALALLREAIEHIDAPTDTQGELITAYKEVSEGLKGHAPDTERVRSKLDWISRMAGPATTVAQAATAVAQLAGIVL